ncbi:sensor histidine kinase [Calidifontibacter sp. DB0510]|uniref:Sensor histidine kinase n=1 Tax=Metallococcus carri TaxID=1656884 RepID=A0A967B4Y0_9MICO|nr:sensor histidine kinase [Metallococcus carri]NHN57425.1 sensor histidine kinase [Metallococcus carri]NOP39179.1 sensor histidine kinase [Calidifontibacter sp. DB2511S]
MSWTDDRTRPIARGVLARFGPMGGTGEEHPRYEVFIGLFWSSIWLFWLIQPFADAWRNPDPFTSTVGMAAVLAFALVYCWHFLHRSAIFSDHARTQVAHWRSAANLGRYALLVALAVLCIVTIGQSGTTAAIFTAISGMWTFPLRVAVCLSAVYGVLYAVSWSKVPGWHADPGSLVGLGFATVAVFAGALANRRQRALDESRLENAQLAIQAERNRMARDLHDILGHSLTVITIKAELAGRLLDVDPERARTEVADLERLSRAALTDVRRAVEGFREISLAGEITRAKSALESAGIDAEVPRALDEVPEDVQEVFAWTVRESVTNVLRHSQATRCEIEVGPGRITVRDNGIGVTSPTGGNGLTGLRERARLAGATLTLAPVQPHGLAVSMAVPGEGNR